MTLAVFGVTAAKDFDQLFVRLTTEADCMHSKLTVGWSTTLHTELILCTGFVW
jgi:hypothetical protein